MRSEQVRTTFIAQIIDSERRVGFISLLKSRPVSETALTARGLSFDPLRGAILKARQGEHDEACWLVFLSAHFARNRRTQWQLCGDFYNKLGAGEQWTWETVSRNPTAVSSWLDAYRDALRAEGGRFGNHRKYESLSGEATGYAIETYVDWVGRSHRSLYQSAAIRTATPQERFGSLYRSMAQVSRFGRIGRFDYLTMLYKLDLADIVPDTCHLDSGATGPKAGAKLLLYSTLEATVSVRELEADLTALSTTLSTTPDVLEDALCNWQKSPSRYVFFAG
ncbi:hypothetical protein [Sanguibacter sp. 26GB23]|uniref:alpha-glutamyl/putrescinyl thymine pyrophosphorylase clade 3 protein n=1 Tax=Sanguibacter sp. 26GB23 TaxID=3156066 RepID=UPI0032AF8B99